MNTRGLKLGIGLVLLALLAYALLSVPFVATNDGPNHLASCVLANQLSDEVSPLRKYLEFGAPVTNLGFQTLCEQLEVWVGWRAAYAAAITLITAAWALGFFVLARAVDKRSPFLCAGFISALGWAFAMGFFTWMLTVAIAFFALAYFLSRTELTARTWILTSLLILLAAISHTFVAMMLGVAIVLLAVMRAQPGEKLRVFVRAILAGVPAAAIALLSIYAGDPGAKQTRPVLEKLGDLADNFVGGPSYRSIPPAVLAVVALSIGLYGAIKKHGSPAQTALAIYAAVCLVAYALLPYHAEQWAYLGPRPMIIGLTLAPLAIPTRYFDRRSVHASVFAVTTVLAVIALGWFAHHQRALEPTISEALSGLDAPIHRTGPRLPLMLAKNPDEEIEHARPLIEILHLYAIDQGGVDPYFWADAPKLDRVIFKARPEVLFGPHPPRYLDELPLRSDQYETYALQGRNFEDVILFADDPNVLAIFERRGYAIDFRDRRLAILRQEKCLATLRVLRQGALETPLIARIVRSVTGAPVLDRRLDAAAESIVAIDGRDCGTLLVELLTEDGKTIACREAGAHRFMAIELAPHAATTSACSAQQ